VASIRCNSGVDVKVSPAVAGNGAAVAVGAGVGVSVGVGVRVAIVVSDAGGDSIGAIVGKDDAGTSCGVQLINHTTNTITNSRALIRDPYFADPIPPTVPTTPPSVTDIQDEWR
jgi:hypothetical protein